MGGTYSGLSGKSKADFGHGAAKFVTYLNVFSNEIANLQEVESVEIDHKQETVKYGDIFFTTSSETPEEVGMSSVWLGNESDVYLNSFCFGYRMIEKIDVYYMASLLRSPVVRAKIKLLAQGISRYNISKKKVMDLFITVPSIEEQKMIGRFFQQINHHITVQQRKSVSKDEGMNLFLCKSNALVDVDVYADSWEQRRLGEISDVRDGTHESPKYCVAGYPFVTSKNISEGKITYDNINYISEEDFNKFNKRSKVDINDILMGMIGTIGNIALVREQANYAIKNVALIKYTGELNPLYGFSYLQAGEIKRQLSAGMDGGTQKFISLNNIRELWIGLPSFIEQQKIGQFFELLDHHITFQQRM